MVDTAIAGIRPPGALQSRLIIAARIVKGDFDGLHDAGTVDALAPVPIAALAGHMRMAIIGGDRTKTAACPPHRQRIRTTYAGTGYFNKRSNGIGQAAAAPRKMPGDRRENT